MGKNNKTISVRGARVHNLQNINVDIPQHQLSVITGLSGSGKSSLAFDTIYAEGQRRYMETFSAYARHFIGSMERPDVDSITGLSPVIAIEQKTTVKNPRSTVGTITEIYDYLRLLYARASTAFSHISGEKMIKYTDEQIIDIIITEFADKPVYILAPLIDGRKGHYKELFESYRKKGFLNARIDGEMREIVYNLKLDRYKTHFIELVVDKIVVKAEDKQRLKKSIDLAMSLGKGIIMLLDKDSDKPRFFSKFLMCPTSGISYKEPAPYTFSFNSPHGACSKCNGLGVIADIDISKIITDDSLSIYSGGISYIGKYRNSINFWTLEAVADKMGFSLKTPINELNEEAIDAVLYGCSESLRLKNTPLGESSNYIVSYEGIVNQIKAKQDEEEKYPHSNKSSLKFNKFITCPKCNGARLNKEALHFRFAGKTIYELSAMDIRELYQFLENCDYELSERDRIVATEVIKEVRSRLGFLLDVGLDYLSLNRPAKSLSGGESQRIRLATQIGSRLVNVLYILDEPSIGLHQRDNNKLINSLKELRDRGNTVIVVEHDKDMILKADYVVDIGPGAGRKGGKLVFSGTPEQMIQSNTITCEYIKGLKEIEIPSERRKITDKKITIKGARGNNLKNIDVAIPLGVLVCVTGVSGSGKSTLLNETLVPVLARHFYNSNSFPLDHDTIKGLEHIDKYIEVNQSPIGKTPRSNPATYTGIFTDIRDLFANIPESMIRGYKPGRFSFNVSGGRCETCKGAGLRTIEMNFLPDVYVQCETCGGKRYNRETLEVRFKGKSISDVLNMTINAAVEFFENIPNLYKKLIVLQQVGLGYISLGQSSTTLSGGEAQRVKLATELMKRETGNTLYILDEPTTGLHFEDIRILLGVINSLIERGNSMIIIEHNMDIIKSADFVIDLGPEGGERGGQVIAVGTPEDIAKSKNNYTGEFLKNELKESIIVL
ncbi:MAG: excinuclease ABC subunit UvrA [Bacteroidales bacterium]|nr:excinuclease ABC subunit UvrA [Bacteroidales bacterium]MDY0141034.1 excinuclease ABC subunit UvrA [Bacteroidales bacterium]